MGLKFVLGRGGIGKTTFMLYEIKKRVQDDETSPVILLVPEQYSFEMEKNMSKLFQGKEKDKYLRSRVLSFKTMSSIVFSKVGGLTDVNINSSGRAMIVYKSIDKITKDLNVYARSATQSGFVSSITDMISELKQYNVSPEILENMSGEIENETLRYKLMDIAKIYTEFEKNLHENYVDSQDMLTSLAEKLEKCDYFKGAYIYIDEFTGFTPNQYGILRVLLKQAKEVYVSLTIDSLTQFTYAKNDAFSRTLTSGCCVSVVCIGVYANTVVPLKITEASTAATVPILDAFLFLFIMSSTLLFIDSFLSPNKLFLQTTGTCLVLAESLTRALA